MDGNALRKLGLTDAEAKAYIALLKLGSATSGPVVDESGVSRSKVYHVLDRLQRKGLVSTVLVGKTRHFTAASPRKLLDYLGYRKEELEDAEERAQALIPELEGLQEYASHRDEAELYHGLEGVKTARNLSLQVLKRGDVIRVFGSDKAAQDAMPAYWKQYHKRRAKQGIRAKYLMKENSRRYLDPIKRSPGLIQIRYLPVTRPVYIDIFADYVITTVMVRGYYASFLIKNRSIADYYREWFDELWKDGKP